MTVVDPVAGPAGAGGLAAPIDAVDVAALTWPPADDRAEDAKVLWTGNATAGSVPTVGAWERFVREPAHRRDGLRAVVERGALLLRGVPGRPGAVLAVAARFGFVRETNYGRLFDVVVTPAPANLAFSPRGLAPHTDNPYRDPAPTVQLLHCLVAAGAGGDTVLVDGFAAAARLRAVDRGAFDVLTSTPVVFAYRDPSAWLRAVRPMISVDASGRIRAVAVNDRSVLVPPMPAGRRAAFDAAAARFTAVLAEPAGSVALRLTPGDCLVLDNTRVLHGRTAFAPDAGRHLQGCYADLDGLTSALALLEAAAS